MAQYFNLRLAVHGLTIKRCHCYADYWINVKKSDSDEFQMDYSIEKNKTIRKFIIDEKLLIHYFYSCFKKSSFNKQYLIVKSVKWFVFERENELPVENGSCNADVLRGKSEIEDVCFGSIIFLVKRFAPSDVEIVK